MNLEADRNAEGRPGGAAALLLDLFRREDGRLVVRRPGENGRSVETPVTAACCFPWTRGREFISLRDDKGGEVVLIESLDGLDPKSRELVEAELTRRLFIPRITAVESIADQTELFHWKVRTDAGARSFLTARTEHPRNLGGGRILIKDVSNDLYLVENVSALDPKSRRLLWMYLD